MVFSMGRELLTSTEFIVGWWKEYFVHFLNPTNKHSEEEFGLGFFITGVKVTGAVKQFRKGSR